MVTTSVGPDARGAGCSLNGAGSRAMLDFVFVIRTYPEEFEPLLAVGRELERRGKSFGVLTISPTIERACAAQRVACANLLQFPNGARPGPVAFRAVEEAFHLVSLRDFCAPEALYLETDREEPIQRRALAYFEATDRYFEAGPAACVVQYLGAEVLRRTVYRTALRRGVPHLWIGGSPFPGMMDLHRDEMTTFDDLDFDPDRPLTIEQRAALQQAIVRLKADRLSRDPLAAAPRITLQTARKFARELRRTLLVDRGADYYQAVWRHIPALTRRTLRKRLARALYAPAPPRPYVFFPLHVPNDSQLSVRAPQFLRQETVVAYLARSLPHGCTLCVKEHPAGIGTMPLRALREIARQPNVALVSPALPALALIEGAEAVVVINSTAGFEALICHKPVVTLARSFYRGRGLTFDCRDLDNLPILLRRALTVRPDPERVDRFLYAVLRASYEGAPFAAGRPEAAARSLIAKLARLRREPCVVG